MKLLVGKAKLSKMSRKRRLLLKCFKLLAMNILESPIATNQPIEKQKRVNREIEKKRMDIRCYFHDGEKIYFKKR
jgi:hypothetical protein